ncbi:MAG: hypothetical protein ACI8RD_001476 [Bacillariaceae sp.]|jgi:hypothetical protein
MSYPFISTSFTLRPPTNDRDKPELTLHQNAVSRIPKETTTMITTTPASGDNGVGGIGGDNTYYNKGLQRVVKRQRLFMDRHNHNDDNEEQYISEEEVDHRNNSSTPIIQRRVSTEFFPPPPSSRYQHHERDHHYGRTTMMMMSSNNNNNEEQQQYWKTRFLQMQNNCDVARSSLKEMEEDQRQLEQRVRELEDQLLIQSSLHNNSNNDNHNHNHKAAINDEKGGMIDGDDNNNNTMNLSNINNGIEKIRKEELPPMFIEIRENHQTVSTLFYMTDGEGLIEETYEEEENEEEEEQDDHDIIYEADNEEEEDRNDTNINQCRG